MSRWGRRWTADDIGQGKPEGTPKRRKYGNKPTELPAEPGQSAARVDSGHEAQVHATLNKLILAGDIVAIARQVRLQLLPDAYMRVDFLVLDAQGNWYWLDAKGAPPTRDWALRQKMARELRGITVHEVYRNWLKNPVLPPE